jgi:DNA topoisomerase-1
MNTSPSSAETLPLDPVDAAAAARLRYVIDTGPGIQRIRAGRSFRYRRNDGASVTDPLTLQRIRGLAIPPAWRDVWICPTSAGHIQAVGRDARGRKQYRYHLRWREVRDETKYSRLLHFGRALPRIRRQVRRDMERPGLPREKVLATVVHLLETTLVRIGNPEYARDNGSYGLTTLRNRHVSVRGPRLRFEFRGKGGKPHTVDSADVNDYIRQAAGSEFTAKDFRTWAGSVLALNSLRARQAGDRRPTQKDINASVVAVADSLRNTPAICRKCYIHPAILQTNLTRERRLPKQSRRRSSVELHPEERAVLAVLGGQKQARRRAREILRKPIAILKALYHSAEQF